MQTFYTDCMFNLKELHTDVENAIDGLLPKRWISRPSWE